MKLLQTPTLCYPVITLFNIQSLLPKIDEVRAIVATKLSSIVCVTETWLNNSVDSSLIAIHGFDVYRQDRRSRRGGGTAVYVKTGILSKEVVISDELAALNCDCCGISFRSDKIFLLTLYIPPNVPNNDLHRIHEIIVDTVDSFLFHEPQYQVIIVGDLNRFNVERLCTDLNLTDIVKKPTRGQNILDHIIISSGLTRIYGERVEYDCAIGKSDHLMITCTPCNPTPQNDLSCNHTLMDLRMSNLASLRSAAAQVDWMNALCQPTISNVDSQWNTFIELLQDLIALHIPMHNIRITNRDKEWITPLTKFLINERWKAYRRGDWAKFNHMKKKVKLEIARAKQLWAQRMKRSSNGLWKLVNHIQGKRIKDPMMNLLSQFNSTDDLLRTLQTQLSETFNSTSEPTCTSSESTSDTQWDVDVPIDLVQKLLSNLSESKAPGHDGIPNKIYKILADIIAEPLQLIFRTSILEQSIPVAWKKGKIIPIPKTVPPDIKKMRYITLLPTPLKILEKILLRQNWNYFQDAFGEDQHGFRPFSSTTTALIKIHDAALSSLNRPSSFGVAIASFDLSRAFDTIDCEIALIKMKDYNFPRGFLNWLRSYLTGRNGYLTVRGQHSSELEIPTGVPQGSVLGPAIFCSYIGDFKSTDPKVTVVKYADDINLVIPLLSSDAADIRRSIDAETENVAKWCGINKLVLNVAKSKLLLSTRREIIFDNPPTLSSESTLTVLGFVLNNKLTFTSHIEHICKKANRRLHVLRRLRGLITSKDLHSVYTLLIRSLFEYACPVFVGLNKKTENAMRKVDKRAHRIMAGMDQEQDFCNCNENTLAGRRLTMAEALMNQVAKIENHLLRHCLPPTLRYTGHYLVPFAPYHKYHQSFFPFMARHLNNQLSLLSKSKRL